MKHAIKVSLQPVKNSLLHPIRLRVSWLGLRCDLSLGVSYNEEKWIKEIGRARQNTRNSLKQSATEINGIIEDAVRWVDAFFVKKSVDGLIPTVGDLKKSFISDFKCKNSKEKSNVDILSIFDKFYLETAQNKGWAINTQKKYNSLKNILKKYAVNCSNFGDVFFRDYINTEIARGRKNTTIAKNIRLFKVFGKYLFERGLIADNFSSFDARLKWSNGGRNHALVYCEFEEIQKLINANDLTSDEVIVRDMFVFSCFSGLRFSDIIKLKKTDVKNNKIYVVTQKTSDSLSIELNKYTKSLFEKYNKETNGFLLFPKITNQGANKILKKIFVNVGLTRVINQTFFCGTERHETSEPLCKIITFHAARRSFVVECLRRGIAPAVIMKWTGHSNFDAMKPYMDIVDSLKTSEMSKFDM